ncbi:MAG: DUF192 domain-containing protein [bacterium]|nr:DUF192 domain-containing protein [bacterium]
MKALLVAAFLLIGLVQSRACSPDQLEIQTQTGSIQFTVEIADHFLSRARGLMNRSVLPPKTGMLFLYDSETPVSFWMKNVPFPLDMLFIDRSGRVVRVHENAKPGDLTPINSELPVLGVLEIPGGASRRAQINPGDIVRHPAFHNLTTSCD